MSRYQKSNEYLARALKVTPGASQTRSKGPTNFPLGVFPVAVKSGKGAIVWDVDDHPYVDWVCGLGAIALGYCDRRVDEAVRNQMENGVSFSLPHILEAEVSERFAASVPGGGMVRWVKTGSEACAAAMRCARAATGRDVVVTSDQSYHGWHDGFTASKPVHPGVPEAMTRLVRTFKYNDLASLKVALTPDVACVLMEATLFEAPKPGFLLSVAQAARNNGSLFILDEMILGGRMAWGGGAEHFGLVPDLLTYGKAIAGGLPLACVVGDEQYLKHALSVSGTFGGDALALAACQEVMNIYRGVDVCGHMKKIGKLFVDGFNAIPTAKDVGARMEGYAWHPRIVFDDDENHYKMSLFLQETAARGVLLHPSGLNVMLAHTVEHVDQTLEACYNALRMVALGEPLDGAPIQPNPFRPVGA